MAKIRIEEEYDDRPKGREGRFSLEEEYEAAQVDSEEMEAEATAVAEQEEADSLIEAALDRADHARIKRFVKDADHAALGQYIAQLIQSNPEEDDA